MATVQQLAAGPTPARPRSINGARDVSMDVDASPSPAPSKCLNKFGSGPQKGDTRIVVIVYGEGQDKIVSVFADVLGKPFESNLDSKRSATRTRESWLASRQATLRVT
ncbi:conserved hypothetical protein [Verticillium alfalfae VaMs.102]|uniref:Uncharacterized protein n=1 Tax=Verticillium alfalfae (strain VaMs.102 / ATCC MYA-4576 / FGSC 10136) TaxID=526221 RepID=C9S612_VERA1|nr:conserved hypothetical protein [Verticillium alfalfae VaMs.102]EEY14351.1 conserved hypothetical protein [Verticillium alfalfae VaMs.102]